MKSSRAHYVDTVLPAHEDFIQHYASREVGLRDDIRRACHLAGALRDLPEFVFPDPLFAALRSTFTGGSAQYRESFWPACRDYQIVCDVANAAKHNTLKQPKNGPKRTISSLNDVFETVSVERFEDAKGFYVFTRKLVNVRTTDGAEHEISSLLLNSLIVWTNELIRLTILPGRPAPPRMNFGHVPRSYVESVGPVQFADRRGEPFGPVTLRAFIYRGEGKFTPPTREDNFDVQAAFKGRSKESPFNIVPQSK